MNERVKILWAKAAESNFGDSWEEQTAFMSKFAELIVRECANFIDSHEQVDKYGFALDIVYGADLMKHFGVEE